MKNFIALIFTIVITFSATIYSHPGIDKSITLATTTSTENSGLLDFINPYFTKKTGVSIKVISLGTGAAIKTAEEGNADIILVHARKLEDQFVKNGYGLKRHPVMYNDFVIIGPKNDPAKIANIKDVTLALHAIAKSSSPFVSRGDNSGTHIKEQSLWKHAKVHILEKKLSIVKKGKKRHFSSSMPAGSWYFSIGQGMGSTINFAYEKQGYTLTDRGTFLAFKKKIDLVVLSEGDKRLFNPYGIIAVNPKKHPHVKVDLANLYIKWITSKKIQQLIESFKIDGKTLFFPNAVQ